MSGTENLVTGSLSRDLGRADTVTSHERAAAGAVAVLLCVHAGADPGQFDEALASMRGQTYPDLRLYVYCDGPLTPALEAVLSSRVPVKDGQHSILRGVRSEGLPSGLNVLITHALSEPDIAFMARMDADDISLPERIETQVRFLEDHPEVSIVGTWCVEFSQPGVPTFYKRMPASHAELTDFMLYRSPFNHPSVMFRRAVFEQGYRYNPTLKLMQDYDLWSRVVTAGFVIANVPEFLLWFRIERNFFSRRAGVVRASREIRMRIHYARLMGKLRLANYPKYAGLFLVRVAPVWAKKLSYKYLRRI
ncbi:glycosyltransferase [Sphingomonas sp. JC676]|uniref:glycosyltransferase n=1 Tax=Sphingomonas sp. JC676 TaxID=2768065 RepID=UPI001657DAD2|nr:glycosyltransferase [Sphingomonas sp. JC676]MBC9030944.1 glycosyltransferase [Sphingomonas sp. JC676]